MALALGEIAKCKTALVKAVRHDIAVELAEYYGAAIFYGSNEKLEQPNNEIRNALNHFARAFEAKDWAEAEDNHRAAQAHLERAKRDSLKLATIGLFQEIRGVLRNAELYYGAIDPAILVRKADLTKRRLDAYIKESAGFTGTTLHMLQIFLESREFLSILEVKYPSVQNTTRQKLWFARIKRQTGALGVAFSLGAASGVVGNYVYTYLTK